MRPSRVRVPKKRNWLVRGALGAAIVLLAGLFLVGRLRGGFRDGSHLNAAGRILETRIVEEHVQDSPYGDRTLYRIEVHVTYELRGEAQDRWLTASEVTMDRDPLAARLASHPGSCEVYWAPHHPENAKCLLR
jgi:hypothetical protein